MEAVRTSETSFDTYQATRRNIPEDIYLYHRCEKLFFLLKCVREMKTFHTEFYSASRSRRHFRITRNCHVTERLIFCSSREPSRLMLPLTPWSISASNSPTEFAGYKFQPSGKAGRSCVCRSCPTWALRESGLKLETPKMWAVPKLLVTSCLYGERK